MLQLTFIQWAILVGVVIIGLVAIAIINRIRARQRPPLYVLLFHNGRIWWLPPSTLESLYARMPAQDRAFVQRHNPSLIAGATLNARELAGYNAIVARARDELHQEEPQTVLLFTDAGQAAFRRRVAGKR